MAKKNKSTPVLAASARIRPVAAASPALRAAPASLVDPDDLDGSPPQPAAPVILNGGPRPAITPRAPSQVTYASGQAKGTVVIDSAARRLFLVQSATTALAYPVSVGREGFAWNGSEKISRVADWPDWHPPAEMRERDPKLPNKMTGGLNNPLGAKALYLGNSLYRIHGTSDGRSVGRASSSGCFRMHNGHVVDLASRIGVGTRVVVKNAPYASTVQAAAAAAPPARPAVVRPWSGREERGLPPAHSGSLCAATSRRGLTSSLQGPRGDLLRQPQFASRVGLAPRPIGRETLPNQPPFFRVKQGRGSGGLPGRVRAAARSRSD